MFSKRKTRTIIEDESLLEGVFGAVIERLSNLPIVGETFGDIPAAIAMVRDWKNGTYKKVPVATIIMIVGAFAYFVSPINIIPDFIPVLGQADDIAVIGLAMAAAHNDISSYKDWAGM